MATSRGVFLNPLRSDRMSRSPARTLKKSYAYCDRLARREAGNFYHAFRFLPSAQRLGMCALYAFLRIADDLSDSQASDEEKRAALANWRQRLVLALAGKPTHRLHCALQDAVNRFRIAPEYLFAVLDGVEMDLTTRRYGTFGELYPYCYRVASVVGLACVHIWGFASEEAKRHAEAAGIAFQLTNILRDLAEDAARGRVYLPQEELERFNYSEDDLINQQRTDPFRELMRFQVERARSYYDASRPLSRLLRPAGRAVFLMMTRTYRGLLDRIEASDYDVFTQRIRLSRWRKFRLAIGVLPVRFGLTGWRA